MDVLGMILLLSSPFLLGMIYYGLVWLDTRFTEEKQQQKTDGALPDWAGQIATVYENPLDHEFDDQMTEGYECPHCGAPLPSADTSEEKRGSYLREYTALLQYMDYVKTSPAMG